MLVLLVHIATHYGLFFFKDWQELKQKIVLSNNNFCAQNVALHNYSCTYLYNTIGHAHTCGVAYSITIKHILNAYMYIL